MFFDAADFGALPTLVGRDRIAVANSALWSTSTVVETIVPLVAAALFAVISPASLIAVDALSYGSAALIRTIVRPLSGSAAGRRCPGRRWWLMWRGLVFLWSCDLALHDRRRHGPVHLRRGIRGSDGRSADRELDVREGDWRLGVLFSSWGVGVLVASLLMPRLVRRLGAARVTLLAMPASALLCALTAARDWVIGSLLMIIWGAYMLVVINAINASRCA